jgi:superfamily II DNA or RNA helicase
MATRETVLPGEIDLGSVQAAVGPAAWAAAHRVLAERVGGQVMWWPRESALQGNLQAAGGFFETTIHLTPGRPLRFADSSCTCRRHADCEHAAALTLAAAEACGQDISGRATRPWEQSLAALLGGDTGPNGSAARVPLAIEVSLRDASRRSASGRQAGQPFAPSVASQPPGGSLIIDARLVQPGKNGGWVAGQLSWSKLDMLRYQGCYAADQVALLRELYSAFLSGNRDAYYGGYGYSSGDQRYLNLARFESRQLWSVLDDAVAAGLGLVYPRKLGSLPGCGTADLCLDVTARRASPPGDLQISPVLRVDGHAGQVVPVRFIGSAGHGLVYADPTEVERAASPADWRFGLARLTRPASAELQDLALRGGLLTVPAAERSRFAAEYCPRLRQRATLISTDESFTPPAVSPPTLVLGAAFGPGHSVDVSWEWQYQVGDSQLRTPLGAGATDAGYRDLAAERAVLDGIDVPPKLFGLAHNPTGSDNAAGEYDAARSAGVTGGADRTIRSAAQLAGLDTMLFSKEVLPLLAGQPGLQIEVSGERADYREASDSLRIAVSADEIAGEHDWFDLGVRITVDGRDVPFIDVFTALSRGESHLLLPDGVYFSLDKPELQALARLIDEARALQDLAAGPLRISRFQADLWGELAALGLVERQAAAWQRQVDGLLSLAGGGGGELADASPPDALTARLRPYQLDGFRWLAFLWEHRLGGILADDMGLGKTLQALALICHARAVDPDAPPFLVVAPTSVASNWPAEAMRFAPDLKVALITETLARGGQELADVTAGADAVVTTYALLRLEAARYSQVEWSGLLLDEAQSVKNHQSKAYQAARKLPAPVKLAITGTPMENNLMELWSLLSITAPGLFPNPVRFQEYYARPIERRGQTELLTQLRRRIRPLVLRRAKEQVAADLPAKQEQVLEVELHPRHRKLYQTHLQRERQKVLGLLSDVDANRFTILRSLTLLRQLSLHAALVDANYDDVPCAKTDALLDQLSEVVAGGHRALVFSQFTGFLAQVRSRLAHAGLDYCYLDGSTRDRAAVIEQFKAGAAPVFLISLKAGGFGLNLTEADYCFLLDPWWNPATEAQAVDRTHRIGQTRNVVVYRLISKDTIEEKVMALKARKSKLFTSVMDSGNEFGGALSADDIRGLFA